MRFKVQTSELTAALTAVTRAIPARAARPILEGVRIETDGPAIRLTATDGSVTITTEASAYVEEDGAAVLPGKMLTELVRKLTADSIDIETDGGSVKIRSGRSRTTMAGMAENEFPKTGGVENAHTVSVSCGALREMIAKVAFAVSPDDTRVLLTGVNVTAEGGRLRLTTLDGFRMARADAGCDSGADFTAVIPGNVMTELARILPADDTECVLTFGAARVRIAFGQTEVYSVLLNGEYPDTKRIVPNDFKVSVLVDRQDMRDAIDRAGLLVRGVHNNLVRVRVDENGLRLTTRDDAGEIAEEVPADVTGAGLEIAFNAKYLADIFRALTSDKAAIGMNTPMSPVIVQPTGGEDDLYLILPVRTA